MRPLIKPNTQADNIITYLQLELAKIVSNKESLCFTTDKELIATVVDQSQTKNLINNSFLTNVNPVVIPEDTQLFIPLADLPFKQTDTDLTIQYALDRNGECLQFISESLFDDYVVRQLTFTLINGSITVQSTKKPKVAKINKPDRQLNTVKQWYEYKKKELCLKSITEVDAHYKNLRWTRREFWQEWAKINPTDFEDKPTKTKIENFYTKTLNPFIDSLQNQ